MDRRSFFSRLAGAAAAVVCAPFAVRAVAPAYAIGCGDPLSEIDVKVGCGISREDLIGDGLEVPGECTLTLRAVIERGETLA